MTKTSGASNGNYIFATYSSPQFDAYEANDKVSLASQIRDNTLLTGNLDSPRDKDYYFYKVGVNQNKVNVSLQGSDSHQLEIYTGAWTVVDAKTNPLSINASPGSQVAMRMVPKPGAVFNPNVNYKLRASHPMGNLLQSATFWCFSFW